MDTGRDLQASPAGPWAFGGGSQSFTRMTALPIVQHHPKMVFRKLGNPNVQNRGPVGNNMHTDLPQSTSNLPLEYPHLLSALDLTKRATTDAFHALVPLFVHAAFSEVAFLNLLTSLLNELTEPEPLEKYQTDNFESLLHYEVIAQRHASQLRHCVRSIQNWSRCPVSTLQRQSSSNDQNSLPARRSDEPAADTGNTSRLPSNLHSSSFSSAGILDDYQGLLDRCLRLLSRIESAKASEMNRAMMLESRRAIEQSERVKQLTLMATYFIPLTFTASLFGMNFGLFGQGDLPVWWYFVFAIPFTLLTHVLYSFDVLSQWQKIATICTWGRSEEKSTKDPTVL